MSVTTPEDQLPCDLLIDGRLHPSTTGDRFTVVDPATTETLAEVAAAAPDDVDRAVEVARRAQAAWAQLPPRRRGALLVDVARAIRDRADGLARLESQDTGKPLRQASADVEVAAQYFEFYGGVADKLYGDTIPLDAQQFAMTFREPLGVTGHIIPWNYPLQISARTTAPSLAAGNACVVKPAEEAPLTTLVLGQLALDAGLPPGVLNIVPGVGEVAGAHLASSDDIDHLSFTGGLDTGRRVMAAAARNVKPITMELGGKSPSIVLPDADLDRAVPTITNAILQNGGQTCSAGSRVIVHFTRHDELVERLVDAFGRVVLGRGTDDPDLGPLISNAQLERVVGHLTDATGDAATVVCGGHPTHPDGLEGYFVEPTLLDDVDPGARVAQEEVFGPVLTVLRYGDEDEAVEIADGTPYGLVTAIWTRDVDRAMRLARRVRSGQVYVNSYGAGGGVALPFGGYRHSGFGREKGMEALAEFTQVKTVAVAVRPDEA